MFLSVVGQCPERKIILTKLFYPVTGDDLLPAVGYKKKKKALNKSVPFPNNEIL